MKMELSTGVVLPVAGVALALWDAGSFYARGNIDAATWAVFAAAWAVVAPINEMRAQLAADES